MNVSTKRPMKSHGKRKQRLASQEVNGQHVSRSAAVVHLGEDEDMIDESYHDPHLNAHGGTFCSRNLGTPCYE